MDHKTTMSISGGTLLVADGGSDVALIELSSTPPSSWDVEYAGWDATGLTSNECHGHPPSFWRCQKDLFRGKQPVLRRHWRSQVWWIDTGNWASRIRLRRSLPLTKTTESLVNCSEPVLLHVQEASTMVLAILRTIQLFNDNLGRAAILDPTNSGVQVLDGYTQDSTAMKVARIQQPATTVQRPSLTTAHARPMTCVVNVAWKQSNAAVAQTCQRAITMQKPSLTMDLVHPTICAAFVAETIHAVAALTRRPATTKALLDDGSCIFGGTWSHVDHV